MMSFAVLCVLLGCNRVHAQTCTGDCFTNGVVSIEEVEQAVQIALEAERLDTCLSADADGHGTVTVDELIQAVRNHLGECASTAPPTATPTPTSTPTATAMPSPGDQIPPTQASDLVVWLQAGLYRDWHAESRVHDSVGPHFGRVRTFVNDSVFDSLSAGEASHAGGSALVKELYGASGDQIQGWSVMVKTQDDSAAGNGWFWFERFGGSTFAAGNGIPLCFGCHGSDYRGLTTRDFVLTPFPLQ